MTFVIVSTTWSSSGTRKSEYFVIETLISDAFVFTGSVIFFLNNKKDGCW